ncbi:ATP synthase F1 subunit epsilon [Staphylospora marina]|uniref:ATP synthase F1 subunit epsilon n=1 Tax=Staphylospora marina TaxID=2490858 RepID=UPI000F5BA930|nr:ATP synthase F1 subunit epsilon [Staphylospora marina]
MAMSKVQLDIVTPERIVYSDMVDMVITRAVLGDVGILPKHAPFVTPLRESVVVRVKKDGREDHYTVKSGFLEVRPDKITILAESADVPETDRD